jgi:hypothetical protein
MKLIFRLFDRRLELLSILHPQCKNRALPMISQEVLRFYDGQLSKHLHVSHARYR